MGMVFALGNQAKRPQTWQLLGVILLAELVQGDRFGYLNGFGDCIRYPTNAYVAILQ